MLVRSGIADPAAIGGPFVIEDVPFGGQDLLVFAVEVDRNQLAGANEADTAAARRKADTYFRRSRAGELLDLEAMGSGKIRMIWIIGLE
jgi:hypothetical protein